MEPVTPLSYVVTGAGPGIGKALVERLLDAGGRVVAIDLDPASLAWTRDRARSGLTAVVGDAADEPVVEHAADLAQSSGTLVGWVNNAAVFQDASVHSASPRAVLDLIAKNLDPYVVGCSVAVRRFLGAGGGGAIVNVSSHQARRPVPGSLPYATAKAAVEGFTRALAVEYGPHGIRANAVAPGTVATERYQEDLARLGEAGTRVGRETGLLHALGRVALPDEVAAAIVHLLSDDASFVSGATVPVDGGRSVLAREPER